MHKEDFDQIKANMKARKITGTYIAFQTSRSASNINMILRGDYPYYKGYGLPKYLYEWLVEHKLLEPTQEGFLTKRAADETVRICSRCGTTNIKESVDCYQCGNRLAANASR